MFEPFFREYLPNAATFLELPCCGGQWQKDKTLEQSGTIAVRPQHQCAHTLHQCCLPYCWDLKPTSKTIVTEKIYYGIKVLETISRKYVNDISIGEAKNIEIRELLSQLDKEKKVSHSRVKMITEPEDIFPQQKNIQSKGVTLLQH